MLLAEVLALAVLVIAAAKIVQGLAAVAVDSSILTERNGAGIPRWIPHALSAALGAAAFRIWRRGLALGVLAAFWAAAAAAFARPAILAAGWPSIPVELAVVPLAAAAGALALLPYGPRLRLALVVAPAVLAVEVAVLALAAAPLLDAAMLGVILAAAGVAAITTTTRRPACQIRP